MLSAAFAIALTAASANAPRLSVCSALATYRVDELVEVSGILRRRANSSELFDPSCPNRRIELDFASSDDQPWVSFRKRECPGKGLLVTIQGRLNNRGNDSERAVLYFVRIARIPDWKCVTVQAY